MYHQDMCVFTVPPDALARAQSRANTRGPKKKGRRAVHGWVGLAPASTARTHTEFEPNTRAIQAAKTQQFSAIHSNSEQIKAIQIVCARCLRVLAEHTR